MSYRNRHPWQTHGPLRVSANGHYLEYADGTGFFWLGDTAWRLAKLGPDDVVRYLEDRARKGFTVIQFNATLFNTTNVSGERPFLGDGPPWSEVRLNESYWRHIDCIVEQIAAHGMHAALFAWWGPNADNPLDRSQQMFTDPDVHNYQYGRALGARYRDAPHLIWVASGEFHHPYFYPPVAEGHLARLRRLVEGVRETDTGGHLCTIHAGSRYSSSVEFHDEDWLDFNMIQTHVYHDTIDDLVSADWAREPAKPTVNGEGWYEQEEELFERRAGLVKAYPADNRQARYDRAWTQRYQAYWSTFFGSIGYTYGHMNLWTMTDTYDLYTVAGTDRPGVLLQAALDAPGASTLVHLRTLIETAGGSSSAGCSSSAPIQDRVPDQLLLAANTRGSDGTLSPDLRCATRDANGRWAMVYTTIGCPVRVVMSRLAAGESRAFWYNPRNGLWHVDGQEGDKQPFATGLPSGPGAPDRHFHTPGSAPGPGRTYREYGAGNDWVLVLEVD